MATRKNPTNADILREIKNVQTSVENVVKDVEELKTWRVAVMAVEAYKKVEDSKPPKSSNDWINRELVKAVIIALGIIATMVTLIQKGGS